MSYKAPTYRLYLDESGTPSYEDCATIDRQFLCVTGVILSLLDAKEILHPNLERVKTDLFPSHHPDHPVIIHRDDVVKKKGEFWPLRDSEKNDLWETELLLLLEKVDFKCISVVINKKSYKEKYGNSAHHPYNFVMNVILERYLKFLEDKNEFGDVMAESRGGNEDMKMKEEYNRLYEHGTYYESQDKFQQRFSSKEIKIKSKNMNVAGLQLADMLCHPTKYLILRGYKKCPDESGNFARRVCKLLTDNDKFFKAADRNNKERILGFGLKYLE